ncbi:hypothetical protein RON43_00555 [Lactobacillus gasseri]|nr:hypothetical protein [Lactobacillus gasseri]MDT9589776.1 hypothetical protein [Lactobacillus gasseri]MDT9610843.1 hypothetical protein [Lactobacillus gasseri]
MLTNREKLRRLGIFACDPYGEEKDICDEDFEKNSRDARKKR